MSQINEYFQLRAGKQNRAFFAQPSSEKLLCSADRNKYKTRHFAQNDRPINTQY